MIKYFSISILLLLFACKKNELDLSLEEINNQNRIDCVNYDFTKDTLSLTSVSLEINGKSYELSQTEDGNAVLGNLCFNMNEYKFWTRLIVPEELDTNIYEINTSGTFDFSLDTLRFTEIHGEKHYTKYNLLNLYSNNNSDPSLLNVEQRIRCLGFSSERLIFEHDSVNYTCYYSHVN